MYLFVYNYILYKQTPMSLEVNKVTVKIQSLILEQYVSETMYFISMKPVSTEHLGYVGTYVSSTLQIRK